MRNLLLISLLSLFYTCSIAQEGLERVKFLIASSNNAEAIDLSKEFNLKNPNNSECYYLQAIAYTQMFKYPEANVSIQKALLLKPENIAYMAELASILLKRDMEKDAKRVLEKVIAKDPVHLNSGIALSNIYLKEKKFQEAYNTLLNLYQNDTTNGYLARNLGLCSIRLKDKGKSITWLTKAINIDSLDIKAYEFITNVMVSIENFDVALSYLETAIRFDPENIDLYLKTGQINTMRNHNFRAIPAYLKAYDLDQDDPLIAKDIGMCYYKVKKYPEAIKYLNLAKKDMEDAQLFSFLGDSYKAMNQYDSSIFYYDMALFKLRPDYNSIFITLEDKAESLYKLNQYEEAVKAYILASEIGFEDAWGKLRRNDILINIAAIYLEKLNDKKMAIEYYKKVEKPEIIINKDYYEYAQQQIRKLNEELFFEGKL